MASSYDYTDEEEGTSPADESKQEKASAGEKTVKPENKRTKDGKEEKEARGTVSMETQSKRKNEDDKEKAKETKRSRPRSRGRRASRRADSRSRSRARRDHGRSHRSDHGGARLRTAQSVAANRHLPPPEPVDPPKDKSAAVANKKPPLPPPPPPPVPKEVGKGNKKGMDQGKKVRCGICNRAVSSKAAAAMDQHQYLNEYCLAVQAWNCFSPKQQEDPAMWEKAKDMAAKLKLSREKATEMHVDDDLRGVSPGTVVSSQRMPIHATSRRAGLPHPAEASAGDRKAERSRGMPESDRAVPRDSRRRRRDRSPEESESMESCFRRRARASKPRTVVVNFR